MRVIPYIQTHAVLNIILDFFILGPKVQATFYSFFYYCFSPKNRESHSQTVQIVCMLAGLSRRKERERKTYM